MHNIHDFMHVVHIKREMGNVLKQCIITRIIVLTLKWANGMHHFLTINRQAGVICNQFLVFNMEYIAKRHFSKEWVSCILACFKQLTCTIKPKFPTSSFIILMAWCKHTETVLVLIKQFLEFAVCTRKGRATSTSFLCKEQIWLKH